ncbi:MAG: glycosyltransferase family 4 protein [Gemmatimonadaceae bacterium]
MSTSPLPEHSARVIGQNARAPVVVLFVHFGNAWIRGSEQCLLDLAGHLDKTKFTPVVICNQELLASEARKLGLIAFVSAAVFATDVIPMKSQVAELKRLAILHGAQVIHANSTVVMPALVRIARRLRIPLVAHLHTTPTRAERLHELLHQANAIVGVSATSIQGFVNDGMPVRAVRMIHNAVDGERISVGDATQLRATLAIPQDAITLGVVCSLIARKNVEMLIEAVVELRERNRNVRLIVVGSGESETALRQLAARRGVVDVVHFLGDRRDAGAVVRDAVDIVVSGAHEESFGLTLIEGGYFGRPTVATDIPSHREILVDGITGLLSAPNDARAFAEKIEILLANESVRLKMGDAARRRVQQSFGLSRYVLEFEALYLELIDKSPNHYGWLRSSRWPSAYIGWILEIIARRLRRS